MLKLRELFGTAIVIVTHDIGVVRAMADTVLVLKNGKTVEYGTADRVLDHPGIRIPGNCWRLYQSCKGRSEYEHTFRGRTFNKNIYPERKKSF